MVKILLVDDHDDVREVLSDVLEREGHDITEASDGDDAVKHIRAEDYDLVITDIMMPNKNGFELISEIRVLKPEIKIIAISGGGNYASAKMTTSLATGVDKTLTKPFSPEDITDAVSSLIAA